MDIQPLLQQTLTAIWQQIKPNVVRYLPFLMERTAIRNISSYISCKEELKANPLNVFVSYDHENMQGVRELVHKLRWQPGINPFFDKESLIKDIPLEDIEGWERPLLDNLHSADCAMICLSPQSIHNKRYFHTKEVPFILNKAKQEREGKQAQEVDPYVILVKLAECRTPQEYEGLQVWELYVDGEYLKCLDTIVAAYKELKEKRGIKPFVIDLNIMSFQP